MLIGLKELGAKKKGGFGSFSAGSLGTQLGPNYIVSFDCASVKPSCGSCEFSGCAGVWLPGAFSVVARVLLPRWLLCGVVPQPNLARDAP